MKSKVFTQRNVSMLQTHYCNGRIEMVSQNIFKEFSSWNIFERERPHGASPPLHPRFPLGLERYVGISLIEALTNWQNNVTLQQLSKPTRRNGSPHLKICASVERKYMRHLLPHPLTTVSCCYAIGWLQVPKLCCYLET